MIERDTRFQMILETSLHGEGHGGCIELVIWGQLLFPEFLQRRPLEVEGRM
jgi:hypothetical protein